MQGFTLKINIKHSFVSVDADIDFNEFKECSLEKSIQQCSILDDNETMAFLYLSSVMN